MQYISLQGQHKHLDISCKGSTALQVSNIYITSRPKQEVFRYTPGMSTLCYGFRYCLEINGNNMMFLVYSNISSYFPDQPASDDPTYSWIMANNICKRIGLTLLYFTKQEELDDFTNMLLEIKDRIPFLEAVL